MAEQVTCITKGAPQYGDCRCITSIQTTSRRYTREQAHEQVKAAPGSIYVEQAGRRADLIPAVREGTKYVRTRPDDTQDDNLLKVREC